MEGAEILDWIGMLPRDIQDAVLSETIELKLAVGAMLYERNAAPKGLYRLVEGRVRLFFLTECGRELLLKIFAPPESIGDLAAVDGQPYPLFAEAQTNCEFRFLPREKLCALRKKYPIIETTLLKYMTRAVRTTLQLVEETTIFSMQARVASRLTWLAASAEARGEPVNALKISQKDIGLMVGASRQAINKVLSDLQKLDVLKTEYGAIAIVDAGKLRAIAAQSTTTRQSETLASRERA